MAFEALDVLEPLEALAVVVPLDALAAERLRASSVAGEYGSESGARRLCL